MAGTASTRKRVEGRAISVPGDDIDTDRIIPARYLRLITFETLGQYAFYDERFDDKGKSRTHPLNDPKFQGGTGGYARYVAICPPGWKYGVRIGPNDAPMPKSDKPLHWDAASGVRVR